MLTIAGVRLDRVFQALQEACTGKGHLTGHLERLCLPNGNHCQGQITRFFCGRGTLDVAQHNVPQA